MLIMCGYARVLSFFFNDTATTEIYTLSLHDALPISMNRTGGTIENPPVSAKALGELIEDRKSTRLNSSHMSISYAVFCLKKKTNKIQVCSSTSSSSIHSDAQLGIDHL